jgi:hypothetical protein
MKPSLIAAGLTLLAGTATASAQTIITREVTAPPPGPVIVTQPDALYAPAPFSPMPAETFVAPTPQPPVQVVETVETVRTTRPIVRRHVSTRHQVVRSRKSNKAVVARTSRSRAIAAPAPAAQQQTIYRTVVRQNVAPDQTVVTDPRFVQPGYTMVGPSATYVAPPPVVTAAPPVGVAVESQAPANVYAVPAPGVATAPAVQPYRYVYEGDRILVVDPNTNIAISALPR